MTVSPDACATTVAANAAASTGIARTSPCRRRIIAASLQPVTLRGKAQQSVPRKPPVPGGTGRARSSGDMPQNVAARCMENVPSKAKKDRTLVRTYPAFGSTGAWRGKFLQLALDGQTWLLFATGDTFRYHNQLLAAFLDAHELAYRWSEPEVLQYDRERVRVTGGGRFALDMSSATLELWDESGVYGRFHAASIKAQIAAAGAPWSGFEVRVRDQPG
jgi:hypothetical protein